MSKWRSGANHLRPYLPEHRGVRLAPLVATVDGCVAEIQKEDWPDLEMPVIQAAGSGVGWKPSPGGGLNETAVTKP